MEKRTIGETIPGRFITVPPKRRHSARSRLGTDLPPISFELHPCLLAFFVAMLPRSCHRSSQMVCGDALARLAFFSGDKRAAFDRAVQEELGQAVYFSAEASSP